MYRNVRKITGFVSALLLFALASPAQLDTGPITVAVKDASGSVVPGANVVLRNENTGIDARTGVSNEQGNFNAPLIPSGSYSVHVELRGFKSYQQSGIYLQVNQQVTITVAVQVGEVSEQATGTGAAPLVESPAGVIRETVDRVRVSELPLNGRNVLQLQVLVPGSVSGGSLDQGAGTPGYAVNGGIAGSNMYSLDGGEYQDAYFNPPLPFPHPDPIHDSPIHPHSPPPQFYRPPHDRRQGQGPYPVSPATPAEQQKAYQRVRPAATTSLNSDFPTPYAQQWNFNIQQPLPFETVLALAYVGSKSSRLFGSHNLN